MEKAKMLQSNKKVIDIYLKYDRELTSISCESCLASAYFNNTCCQLPYDLETGDIYDPYTQNLIITSDYVCRKIMLALILYPNDENPIESVLDR